MGSRSKSLPSASSAARRVDRQDGPLGRALEEVVAHRSVVLSLRAAVAADERVQAQVVARVRDGAIRETEEVEEVDVGRVIGRRPHVLERHERPRTLVPHEELAEVGMEGAREVPVAVEPVELAVGEGEVVGRQVHEASPGERSAEAPHERPPCLGGPPCRDLDDVARTDGRQDAHEWQRRQIEAVPLHLVDADPDVVREEGDADDGHGDLLEHPASVRERERRKHDEDARPIELEHLAHRVEPRTPDVLPRARLHVERVGDDRAVVQEAKEVPGHRHRKDARDVREVRARDGAPANGLHHERQADEDREQVKLGAREAAGARQEPRVQVRLRLCGAGVTLPRSPQDERTGDGQERRERLLETALGPKHEAGRHRQPKRPPHVRGHLSVTVDPLRHPRRRDQAIDPRIVPSTSQT